jgi:hypothetical protein
MEYYNHMRFDPLERYAKFKQQLFEEKRQLEGRLAELNQALGSETASSQTSQNAAIEPPSTARRGRRGSGSNGMSMRDAVLKALSKGPLARKELVQAVEGVGYKFSSKNALNSIGSILYGKNSPVKRKGGKFFLRGGAQGAADATASSRQ